MFFDGEEAFVNWGPTDSIYGARHLVNVWGNTWYPKSVGSSFDIVKELDRIVSIGLITVELWSCDLL